MKFKDPQRDRKRLSPGNEIAIYWLSPHERMRREHHSRRIHRNVYSVADRSDPICHLYSYQDGKHARTSKRPSLDQYDRAPID